MAIERGTEEDYELVHGEKEDLQERGEKNHRAYKRSSLVLLGRLLNII